MFCSCKWGEARAPGAGLCQNSDVSYSAVFAEFTVLKVKVSLEFSFGFHHCFYLF